MIPGLKGRRDTEVLPAVIAQQDRIVHLFEYGSQVDPLFTNAVPQAFFQQGESKIEPWKSQTDWTEFKTFLSLEKVAEAIQPTAAMTAVMGPP